ncbi:MAG TPA: carbohydrate ABC transporter permease [Clostridiales bacterium]|nr:carbohydrate ABC transporter permease [Clostridiales bacterium]
MNIATTMTDLYKNKVGDRTVKTCKTNRNNLINKNNKANRIKMETSDLIYYLLVNIFLTIITLVVLYPLIFIVSASFSSPIAVSAGKVLLWPVDFSLEGYKAVFKSRHIVSGYLNTFIYTGTGTAINIAMTMIAAYALSRKEMPFRGIITFLFTFTMLFGGGMIPNYILMLKLGMINTRWAIIIPGAISVYNMIIARTFIQNIPNELLEAAQIDGCSDSYYFFKIVLPLSKALIAILTLYYSVGHWNSYFDAFLYLSDRKLYPLQIILREILVANSIPMDEIVDPETMNAKQGLADLLKYSLIIVSSVPVLILYPFIQKYFIKGVMIGSLKG